MKKLLLGLLLISPILSGCEEVYKNSDKVQQIEQEKSLKESVSQIGMPAIKNFREKKLLKEILELRDQTGLITYVYIVSEMTGKLVYLGEAVGYGIPYATQFTSPQKDISVNTGSSVHMALPQADPNGLFSPASADGTWILMKNPNGKEVKPVYIEPKIIVSPFKLNN